MLAAKKKNHRPRYTKEARNVHSLFFRLTASETQESDATKLAATINYEQEVPHGNKNDLKAGVGGGGDGQQRTNHNNNKKK